MTPRALDWLATRDEPPPAALRTRLEAALGELPSDDARPVPEAFLVAGEALLARLLNADRTNREGALDLLAADALVTYAFEAAAEEGSPIAERARRAMTRIAALAAG
jgi:hypothetical protein